MSNEVGGWQGQVTQGTPVAHEPNPWDDDDSERHTWPVPDDAESCPLCGETVIPADVQAPTGVPWGSHHHAHALCALENLAARVAELERILLAIHGPRERP